jgi:hypothetical protein
MLGSLGSIDLFLLLTDINKLIRSSHLKVGKNGTYDF